MSGRFVILQMDNGDDEPLNLKEVKAFGESDGTTPPSSSTATTTATTTTTNTTTTTMTTTTTTAVLTTTSSCGEWQQGFLPAGNDVPGYQGAESAGPDDCAKKCGSVQDCAAWTLHLGSNQCWLKTTDMNPWYHKDWAWGEPCNSESSVELSPLGASLSSTLQNNNFFGAAKCIDGNTDGPDEGVQDGASADFCHTENEPTPWLAIDYGTTVTVQRVEIFNRRQCCGFRTRNVDVRISDVLPTSGSQMFSGGTLLGRFVGPGSDGQQITISGQAMSGRFVILQMNNGDDEPLNLKEVKAFGESGHPFH